MIYPPKLKTGDVVGILAPARKISPGQLEGALKTIQHWGLKPLLAKNIFSSKHSYLAGSDDERREDFQNMISDPGVKAIEVKLSQGAKPGLGGMLPGVREVLDELVKDAEAAIAKATGAAA